MIPQYSLEAHLLHSGLQMIWKRLNSTRQMDARDILRQNRNFFIQVAEGVGSRFGVTCTESDMKSAAEMLHHAFQLNIAKSCWVIVREHSGQKEYGVTIDDDGNIVQNDPDIEWNEQECYEMMIEIKTRHPKESIWMEQRIPRYVRRVYMGD